MLKAGIKDENLRGKLVKLTEGYPIFLDLCVDVYVEYKRQNNNQEPTIKEFGSKRQDVVARILRYIIEDKDDAARDMLEFLCMLNVWTDELAFDIGKKALERFSRNTYKRVKNFSFIQEERIENEDLALTFYRFDKTIQSIIVKTLDKKFIDDVTTAVEKYFDKFFDDNSDSFFEPKTIFYLKLWAEILARFANDAETLWDKYDDNLFICVDSLIKENESLDTVEEILNLFMSKIESLGDKDSEYYANFEAALANLRTAQVRYDEAYELAKSAYEKFLRSLGEDDLETIDAMGNLALKLSDLGRYEEALPLQEKVLAFYEEVADEEDEDTDDDETNDLMDELEDLAGYYDEALITSAMNNLANTLGDLGRYEEALTLREKVLELRKKILGEDDEDTINAMADLADTLYELERYEDAVNVQQEALTMYKKVFGEEDEATLMAMNNLAMFLHELNRDEEAQEIIKRARSIGKKVLSSDDELFAEIEDAYKQIFHS